MRKRIQVFEYQTLAVGELGFTQEHFDRLGVYHDRLSKPYFALEHRRIRFQNWVGVIQTGDLTIEVLPKTDDFRNDDEGAKSHWHDVLIDMLRRSGYLRLELHTNAQLQLKSTSLLDIYLEAFLGEVQGLVHQGLTKRYRLTRGNLGVLKGRLLFAEHVRQNLTHRERFFTEHQQYDRNNAFNCILKAALVAVGRIASATHLLSLVAQLLPAFDTVGEATAVTEDTFRRLAYDRNTERYRAAVRLAELILLNMSPDVHAGHRDTLAIMFEMDALFEHYVYSELKRAERDGICPGFRVSGQVSKTFWKPEDNLGYQRIRPDLRVELTQGGKPDEVVILDTKWKVPANGRPADADLKQMYVYNLQFGATRSFLLYPCSRGGQTVRYGGFEPETHKGIPPHGCGMWFVTLLDEQEKLDRSFGRNLVQRIKKGKLWTSMH